MAKQEKLTAEQVDWFLNQLRAPDGGIPMNRWVPVTLPNGKPAEISYTAHRGRGYVLVHLPVTIFSQVDGKRYPGIEELQVNVDTFVVKTKPWKQTSRTPLPNRRVVKRRRR